jgi:hypothetical protein
MTKVKEKYVFEVEHVEYRSDDDDLTGREVRSRSGHNPAANYRLIQIHDRHTASVGLEAPVKLEEGEKPVFRIMEGDRTYEFTVEDLGWEWGAATISESDVRAYGKIANDRDIVVDAVGQSEIVVPRGGLIGLDDVEIERIYSRKAHPSAQLHVTFVINGEPNVVKGKTDDTLESLLERALKESENTGQNTEAWQVTNEPGNVLDVTKTLSELGITDGAILLASLKTGAAG